MRDRCTRDTRMDAAATLLPPALVAQGIEHRPPEPCAQVRILPRAPCDLSADQAIHPVQRTCCDVRQARLLAATGRCDWEDAGRRVPARSAPQARADAALAESIIGDRHGAERGSRPSADSRAPFAPPKRTVAVNACKRAMLAASLARSTCPVSAATVPKKMPMVGGPRELAVASPCLRVQGFAGPCRLAQKSW